MSDFISGNGARVNNVNTEHHGRRGTIILVQGDFILIRLGETDYWFPARDIAIHPRGDDHPPEKFLEWANEISNWMKVRGNEHWALGPIMSRVTVEDHEVE